MKEWRICFDFSSFNNNTRIEPKRKEKRKKYISCGKLGFFELPFDLLLMFVNCGFDNLYISLLAAENCLVYAKISISFFYQRISRSNELIFQFMESLCLVLVESVGCLQWWQLLRIDIVRLNGRIWETKGEIESNANGSCSGWCR